MQCEASGSGNQVKNTSSSVTDVKKFVSYHHLHYSIGIHREVMSIGRQIITARGLCGGSSLDFYTTHTASAVVASQMDDSHKLYFRLLM